MKCDRCGNWHQRTVLFDNEHREPREERLCLTCIANLTFGRVDRETEQSNLAANLKGLLSVVTGDIKHE